MKGADRRLAVCGAAAILAGLAVGGLVDLPALRLLGSLSLVVIGFGLVRQAFRID